MKPINPLDAINSNFLFAKFLYPRKQLLSFSKNYFKNRKYEVHSKGILSARESILNYYDLEKKELENIIITASTSESYLNILTNIAQEGEVLFPSPSYPLFEYLSKYSNTKYSFYNLLDSFGKFDIESLKSSIKKDTKCVVLITPNNPTGTIINKLELLEIVKICKENSIKLIVDTVFEIFNYTDESNISPKDIKEDIEVFWFNGISKMFALPDLKIAWIYYQNPNKITLDEIETFNDTFLNANYLSQSILQKLFDNSQKFQAQMLFKLRKNMRIAKEIDENYFNYSVPQGGIHFICSLKNKCTKFATDQEFSDYLEKYFKLITHPLSYYDYKSKSPSIVMSILHTENEMKEIIKRLNNFAIEHLIP